jgi:hypothetical protein
VSIEVMTNVWKRSPYQAGALLVHLALADFANADARCWASQETLSEKSRLSPRQVGAILRTMEADRTIIVVGTRGRTNRVKEYLVRSNPEDIAGLNPEVSDAESGNLSHLAPLEEPSMNRQGRSPNAQRVKSNGKRQDLLFEAVMEVSGILLSEIPDAARGRYGKAVSILRGLKATPEEVRRRAGHAWFQITPSSLASRWAELRRPPGRNGKPGIDWDARAKRAAELDAKEDAEREEAERAAKRS